MSKRLLLKQPGLNSLVLYICVFQDRPDGGHKICLKRFRKYVQNEFLNKKNGWKCYMLDESGNLKNYINLNVSGIFSKNDIGPINVIILQMQFILT